MALRYILLQCVIDCIVQTELSQAGTYRAAGRKPAGPRRLCDHPLFLALELRQDMKRETKL